MKRGLSLLNVARHDLVVVQDVDEFASTQHVAKIETRMGDRGYLRTLADRKTLTGLVGYRSEQMLQGKCR